MTILSIISFITIFVVLLCCGCTGPFWKTPDGRQLQASLARCAVVEALDGAASIADALKDAYNIDDEQARTLAISQLRLRIAAELGNDVEQLFICLLAAAVRTWTAPPAMAMQTASGVFTMNRTWAGLARARATLGWYPEG